VDAVASGKAAAAASTPGSACPAAQMYPKRLVVRVHGLPYRHLRKRWNSQQ